MLPVRAGILVAIALVAPGCKWLKGDRADALPAERSQPDPLLGMRRIDPQSGVLGTDPLAGRERDPLVVKPAGRGRTTPAANLPPRNPTARDSSRRPPFRPQVTDSPAALAGMGYDSDLTLNRDEPGEAAAAITPSYTKVADRLKQLGGTVSPPRRNGDEWTLTVTVPIPGDPPGTRRYTGTGPTATAAAANALEQLESQGE